MRPPSWTRQQVFSAPPRFALSRAWHRARPGRVNGPSPDPGSPCGIPPRPRRPGATQGFALPVRCAGALGRFEAGEGVHTRRGPGPPWGILATGPAFLNFPERKSVVSFILLHLK